MIIGFTNDMFLDVLFQGLVITMSHPRRNSEFMARKGIGRHHRRGHTDARLPIESGHTGVVGLALVALKAGRPLAARLEK